MTEAILPSLAATTADNLILLLLGLVLLVKGSGLFVSAAGTIARRLGVSELIIGLTLVAVGTSLPELVAAVIASLRQEGGLVLGNVIGANIANMTLIVGGAASLRAMRIERAMLERDGYLALVAAALLALFAVNNTISGLEGMILFLLFVAYTAFLVQTSQTYGKAYHVRHFAVYFLRFGYVTGAARAMKAIIRQNSASAPPEADATTPKAAGWRNAFILLLGIALIVVGGNLLVDEAVFFASHFRLPVSLVGVVLALGTTAPEMSVSIAAARQRMGGMVIGNAIGSVLTNSFLIVGIAALISPIPVATVALLYALPVLVAVTLILLLFKKTNYELRRPEGVALCLLYVLFIVGYAMFS